jgi:hypothetical protein
MKEPVVPGGYRHYPHEACISGASGYRFSKQIKRFLKSEVMIHFPPHNVKQVRLLIF